MIVGDAWLGNPVLDILSPLVVIVVGWAAWRWLVWFWKRAPAFRNGHDDDRD